RKRMTLEQFLAWEERQELRHEFDGVEVAPVVMGIAALHPSFQKDSNHPKKWSSCSPADADGRRERSCSSWPALTLNAALGSPSARAGLSAQWQRLFAQHVGQDNAARFIEIEMMRLDHRRRLRQDRIDVLHQLEPLEQVRPNKPHALTDQFQEVDDLERP